MAYHKLISLSDAEALFLTTLAASEKQIFATKDAYDVLDKSKATRDALARLVNKGWLERIEKGKYLIVPLEAGPDRTWTEDAHVMAGHLVSPAMGSYWSALNYWNLTEQVPRINYVQTTARKENRRPRGLGMQFRIVRVKPRKFFGSRGYRAGQFQVEVTDRERAIVDCLDRPDLSGGGGPGWPGVACRRRQLRLGPHDDVSVPLRVRCRREASRFSGRDPRADPSSGAEDAR